MSPLQNVLTELCTRKEFVAIPGSINHVFPISSTYLKFSRSHKEGAILERFAWNCATIFGCRDYFVPTTLIHFVNKTDHLFRGREEEVLPDLKGRIGSIQSHQEGEKLTDSTTRFKKEELLMPFAIAILFGPYDWHSGNIIVAPEKHPKFFDNARCFPNSNQTKMINGSFISPFRFGLLRQKGCYVTLSEQDRNFLSEKIAHFREKIPEFTKEIKALKSLPNDWVKPKEMIQATLERLDRLEQALACENVRSLADIICFIYPKYRFFVSLFIIQECFKTRIIKKTRHYLRLGMEGAGAVELRLGLMYCAERGLNAETIFHQSTNLSIPLHAFIENLTRQMREVRTVRQREAAMRVFQRLQGESAFAPRDFIVEDHHRAYRSHVKKVLGNNPYFRVKFVNDQATIHSKTLSGKRVVEPLDLKSFPGYARFKGKLLTLKELAKEKSIPFYHPRCSEIEALGHILDDCKGWLMIGKKDYKVYTFQTTMSYKVVEVDGEEKLLDEKDQIRTLKEVEAFWNGKGLHPILPNRDHRIQAQNPQESSTSSPSAGE